MSTNTEDNSRNTQGSNVTTERVIINNDSNERVDVRRVLNDLGLGGSGASCDTNITDSGVTRNIHTSSTGGEILII